MKNKYLILILIIFLLSSLFLVACSNDDKGPDEVSFEDENFRSELLQWFDIRFPDSNEGQITEERLRQHDLTVLPIMNYENINSIEDIKILPYLENVTIIGSSKLKDYSPLHNLKMLKDLTVVNFQNGAFDELESIPSLRNLNLQNNPDINLEFLNKLPNINYLNVSGTKLKDISEIKKLKHLERLDASSNNILSITDLGSMKNLKIIDIRNNPINNLRWLTKLDNEKITIIISQWVYNEFMDEELLSKIEESEETKIEILNSEEVHINDVLTNNEILEKEGIKIYIK